MQVREKVAKSRNTLFFQWFVAPEGRKVGECGAIWPEERWKIARRCGAKHISNSKCTKHLNFGALLKLRCGKSAHRHGAKHIWKSKCIKHTTFRALLEVAMFKKCTPLWREAHFEVKMYKTHHTQNTFGSCDVQKVHDVVARSTFPSQNVQNTSASERVWKLRRSKSVRRCGAKHMSKSKCTKHQVFAPLLEVEMSEKSTPLWREAHFEVKRVNNWRSRAFWTFRCRFA